MTKQETKQQIAKLVEKYQRVAGAGKIKSYNEAQTRNEFIEPLFEFLGWDMRNLTTDNEVTTEENVFIELNCRDFINRFDQLWLLSKESFEQKLLDREAEKWGKLTQRKQVGEKLFEDLMSWRVSLTKDFKKQNTLTDEELDEGVQRILDRLIFIRTAEDRKIEQNILLSLLREWE